MSDLETKNAVIQKAIIDIGDRGFLTASLSLDYGYSIQSFGGFALYLPKSFQHHRLNSSAGHFIFRVLEIAGVDQWDQLINKCIRVKATDTGVSEIGHIINDDWFNPQEEFKE
jgi:hypothetical protein